MVMVNLPTAGVDYHVPFGGRKGSSYGPREQGALREGVLHDGEDGLHVPGLAPRGSFDPRCVTPGEPPGCVFPGQLRRGDLRTAALAWPSAGHPLSPGHPGARVGCQFAGSR